MVILIVALLVALLVPAIGSAVRRAREAAVSAEINGLAQGLAAFRDRYGDYPPSRIVLTEDGDYSGVVTGTSPSRLAIRSIATIRKFWPRVFLTTTGPGLPAGGAYYDVNNSGTRDKNPVLLTGDECLVFFLGGVPVQTGGGMAVGGFGKRPNNPWLPGDTNRAKGLYDFRPGRLTDLNGNGFPEYSDDLNPADPRPFAYFSSYDGVGYDPDDVNYPQTDDNGLGLVGGFEARNAATPANPLKDVRLTASPGPNPYTTGVPLAVNAGGAFVPAPASARFEWQKAQTFQLISAGYDGLYGIGGAIGTDGSLLFAPDANATVTGVSLSDRKPEDDNLTNLSGGRLQ